MDVALQVRLERLQRRQPLEREREARGAARVKGALAAPAPVGVLRAQVQEAQLELAQRRAAAGQPLEHGRERHAVLGAQPVQAEEVGLPYLHAGDAAQARRRARERLEAGVAAQRAHARRAAVDEVVARRAADEAELGDRLLRQLAAHEIYQRRWEAR